MTARSPASAIAIISEMKCNRLKTSKVILGVTVLGDVVVLILFALCTSWTRVATEGGTFGASVLAGVSLEILASVALGAVSSQMLRLVIPYNEEGEEEEHETSGRHIELFLRGGILIAILFAIFMVAEYTATWTQNALHIEPLLACTVASCICGHDTGRRHGLEMALGYWTPIILLPFFTLAGASLKLIGLMQVLPAACGIVLLRMLGIAMGSMFAGHVSRRAFPDLGITPTAVRTLWMTLLAQAGVTLGLVLEVQEQFEEWGKEFATLVIGVVVLNQLLGPVLCRVGLQFIVAVEGDGSRDSVYEETEMRKRVSAPADVSVPLRVRIATEPNPGTSIMDDDDDYAPKRSMSAPQTHSGRLFTGDDKRRRNKKVNTIYDALENSRSLTLSE